MLSPKSIALIGASHKKGKVGNAIAKNLLLFKNSYFVNPTVKNILGKKSYASVLDIPSSIDVAVIAVKAEFVPEVLEECGKKKIKTAIIITAGFSELRTQAAINLEKRISEIAKKNSIRILGPNCFGIINPYLNLNTTFASIPVQKGTIAFLSQSGALCSTMLDIAQDKFGFSYFASVGNMSDIDFSDLIEMLNNDKNTKSIIIYMEALKPESGGKFIAAARKSKKPIIVLKSGISERGAKTALTHTGSLASGYGIYQEAFREAGIHEARNLSIAIEKAKLFSGKEIKKNNGIVILSNAGGPAVLAADYCEQFNVMLATIPENVMAKLNSSMPSTWNKSNPMDIIGDADAERYRKALSCLNFKFDCLVCILTPQEMAQPEETAKALAEFEKKSKIPVIAAFLGGKRIMKSSDILEKNKIPLFKELRDAIEVIS